MLTTSRRFDWRLHWDEQRREDKEWLWGELKDLFELDEIRKKPTLQSICSGVFRNRKAKWKAAGFAQYKKHEDHIRHKPEMLTEKELEDLVTFWSEDEGQQVLSERNTIKRSQQVVKHIGGKKSIARSIAEMTEKNGGVPPTEGDIFIKYHTSKKSKKAKNPVSEDFIVQMRERAGLDENGFDENDVKQSIPDYIYKEVVPAATRHRKRARVVEDGTTSCASSGYSSRIGELEQQVVDLKDIIFEKDKETERIIGELTKENDRRFKEFEKRMMDNVASLVFRPEQFFRPQEQVFIPQHPLYRGATSDPLYRAAISDPFYRAATSSSGEHGCSSRLH